MSSAVENYPVRRRDLPKNWQRNDILLTLGVLILAGFSLSLQLSMGIFDSARVNVVWMSISTVVLILPLMFGRRWPGWIGLLIAGLFLILGMNSGYETMTSQVVLYTSFYWVGAWEPNRKWALVSRAIIVTAMAGWLLWFAWVTITQLRVIAIVESDALNSAQAISYTVFNLLINVVFFSAGWYFGNRSWEASCDRRRLDETNQRLRAAQETIAEQAVSAERLHIARELHDVVAHHVTVMGIHASAARRLMETAPENTEPVVSQLTGIEKASQQAISELQSMVYTLRDKKSFSDDIPSVERLPQLVESAQTGDQKITFEIIGTPAEVSAAVGMTLYRITQEALSNARKHAGRYATVNVRLRYRADTVELEISDDGHGSTRRVSGTGTGIQGMNERMRAINGTVESGPKSRGGWMVRATAPLSEITTQEPSNV